MPSSERYPPPSFLRQALGWIGRREPVVLSALLVLVTSQWIMIALADAVSDGETKTFDEWALRAMRQDDVKLPIGPRWLPEVGRDITALGGASVLTLVTLAVAGFLWLRRMHGAMLLVLVATVGGLLASTLLKNVFDRPRPELIPHLSVVHTSSFPSGHAMLSAVVYLTLGALLCQFVGNWRLKGYVLFVAVLLTFLVGLSRIYLGVHYPSDVLAGWSAGLAWALGCWLAANWLQRRGTVIPQR